MLIVQCKQRITPLQYYSLQLNPFIVPFDTSITPYCIVIWKEINLMPNCFVIAIILLTGKTYIRFSHELEERSWTRWISSENCRQTWSSKIVDCVTRRAKEFQPLEQSYWTPEIQLRLKWACNQNLKRQNSHWYPRTENKSSTASKLDSQ